jgi:aminoglycoside phosphotransferase (APT) family kinase protein
MQSWHLISGERKADKLNGLPDNHNLPSDLLHWIADAIGPGTTVESVRQLQGATSSTLYAVDAARNGRRVDLVLRRFTNREWLREEPDIPQREAESMRMARRVGVSAPEPVALDDRQGQDGVPVLLMTRLPGAVDLLPDDMDGWLYGLAEAILPLHSLEAADFPWEYAPYNDVTRLAVPAWSSCPDLWRQAIEIVNGPWPEAHTCFIHRDYHPTNVLWQDGRVSGVVDWPNGCRGPVDLDLAWCRMNLAGMYGVEVADRFLHAYESLAGSAFGYRYHPFWDLIVIIEGLPGPPDVYPPWVEFGMSGLTDALMLEREDAYLNSVMGKI